MDRGARWIAGTALVSLLTGTAALGHFRRPPADAIRLAVDDASPEPSPNGVASPHEEL